MFYRSCNAIYIVDPFRMNHPPDRSKYLNISIIHMTIIADRYIRYILSISNISVVQQGSHCSKGRDNFASCPLIDNLYMNLPIAGNSFLIHYNIKRSAKYRVLPVLLNIPLDRIRTSFFIEYIIPPIYCIRLQDFELLCLVCEVG